MSTAHATDARLSGQSKFTSQPDLPPPLIPAGVIPFDIAAWKARREKRPTAPPVVAPIVMRSNEDADWLEWHLKNTEQPLLSNDELRAIAVAKGKPIAPGTLEQHDQYTREFDGQMHGDLIRAFRQYAIFGFWPDGTKNGPDLPAMDLTRLKWLAGQSTLPKYLKWYRAADPEGFACWLETHPSYRSQAGLPPLAATEPTGP